VYFYFPALGRILPDRGIRMENLFAVSFLFLEKYSAAIKMRHNSLKCEEILSYTFFYP
jgi:hypothetical protein